MEKDWASKIHEGIEVVFTTLRIEIHQDVDELRSKGFFKIRKERDKFTRKYSQHYHSFFENRIDNTSSSFTSSFYDLICSRLIYDGHRLDENEEINYFFDHDFDHFKDQLKSEHRKAIIEYQRLKTENKTAPDQEKRLSDHRKFDQYKKEDVVDYICQLLGRQRATYYANNLARNNGEFKPDLQTPHVMLTQEEKDELYKSNASIANDDPVDNSPENQPNTNPAQPTLQGKKENKENRTELGAAAIAMYYILAKAGIELETLGSNAEKTRFLDFIAGYGLVSGPITGRSMYQKVNELWPVNDDKVDGFNSHDLKMAIMLLERFKMHDIAEMIKQEHFDE
ncbi:MAG: hypothetical protein JXQ87_12785 [Bacteroidia bacterium]